MAGDIIILQTDQVSPDLRKPQSDSECNPGVAPSNQRDGPEEAQRIIIRAHVQDIPGDPLARPFTLGNLFCQSIFKRALKLEYDVNGFDAVHVPPDFDSENNVKVWFMLDFGVKGPIERQELVRIPLHAFIARIDDEHGGQQLTFTPRRINESYVRYCSQYKWGASELG